MAKLRLMADSWRQPRLDADGEPTKNWDRRRQGDIVEVPDDQEEDFLGITVQSDPPRPMFVKPKQEREATSKKSEDEGESPGPTPPTKVEK